MNSIIAWHNENRSIDTCQHHCFDYWDVCNSLGLEKLDLLFILGHLSSNLLSEINFENQGDFDWSHKSNLSIWYAFCREYLNLSFKIQYNCNLLLHRADLYNQESFVYVLTFRDYRINFFRILVFFSSSRLWRFVGPSCTVNGFESMDLNIHKLGMSIQC